MNFFGIGMVELAVIFLVAFLVMGPAKTIEMARSAGKLIGDLRRTVNDMTAAADLSGLDRASGPATPNGPASSNGPASPTTLASQQPFPTPTGSVPTTGLGESHGHNHEEDSGENPDKCPEASPGNSPGDVNEQRP